MMDKSALERANPSLAPTRGGGGGGGGGGEEEEEEEALEV
jgi:hypothetical protein